METFEAIQKRRSVRQFTGEIIPREHLEKLWMPAGWLHPEAIASLGLHVVTTRPPMIEQAYRGWKMDEKGRRDYRRGDRSILALEPGRCSAAIQNMLVASTAWANGSVGWRGDSLPLRRAV